MGQIERAVIFAAGRGSRLVPVTDLTPKPLLKIHGKRILDTIIDALHANGINEIYIVTGYLKEQFELYAADRPGIVTIENPYYKNSNNISSAYVAREHIDNAFIIEADLIINRPAVFNREFSCSGYCGLVTDSPSEWGLTLDPCGRISACAKDGSSGSRQLVGVSFWSGDDAAKLRSFLVDEFEVNKNTDVYWDEIPIFKHSDSFSLCVRDIGKGDITEIDDLQDLAAADNMYSKYSIKGYGDE